MAEILFFEPRQGAFDIEEAARVISGLGHPVRDPASPTRFLLFADEAEAKSFAASRTETPRGPLPYVCIINLAPSQISVTQLCEQAELALARQFEDWLLAHYDCIVSDDEE